MPLSLHPRISDLPLVWLEAPFDERAERILQDYVISLCAKFVREHGPEQGP